MKNTGLRIEKLPITEKVFGSKTRLKAQQVLFPDGIKPYLPKGERQSDNNSRFDSLGCVSFSHNTCIETIFKCYIKDNCLDKMELDWLEKNGYMEDGEVNLSDRFLAKVSGTSSNGNTMHNVAEAGRKNGYVPERVWDSNRFYNDEVFNLKEYYKTILESVMNLGKEFFKRWDIGYEVVINNRNDWLKALLYSPLQVGVYAWPTVKNGIYPRVEHQLNHATMNFSGSWFAFDTYEVADSFIKQLAPNYKFMYYAYKFSVKPKLTKLNFNRKIMKNRDEEFIRTTDGGFYFTKKGTEKVQKIDSIGGILTVMDRQPGVKATTVSDEEFQTLTETREFFAGLSSDIKES